MSSSSTLDLYESTLRAERPKAGARSNSKSKVTLAQPKSADDIAAILQNTATYPSPLRPLGSGSAVTRCATTAAGTILDMSLLDRVLSETENTVTVQAGIRLRDLAEYLAHEGKELVCGCIDPNRTVGGAISSGTLGGGMPGDASQLASAVCQITLINGMGRRVEITEKLPDLLVLTRMSYGLLGVVYSVKLRTRPIQSYVTRNSKFDFDEFANVIPTLMEVKGAVRASMMPFRDKVYVELRYPDDSGRTTANLPSKLRQWAAEKALPSVVRSVGKVVPVKNLRDPLIDGVTEATHVLFASTSVASSNAADQTGAFKIKKADKAACHCVWFFPAAIFPEVLKSYRRFCAEHYKRAQFRCDLPAEVWRIDHDRSSLLSPSFDSAVFAVHLRATAEGKEGWDDFLYEFAEFASRYKGIPVFNQTRAVKPGYAYAIYGERLKRFKEIRLRLDPKNRLLNQFFAEILR